MKLQGSVDKLEDHGDAIVATLTNVRRKKAAAWVGYGPCISFHVNHAQARRSYPIGTTVEVIIRPKK